LKKKFESLLNNFLIKIRGLWKAKQAAGQNGKPPGYRTLYKKGRHVRIADKKRVIILSSAAFVVLAVALILIFTGNSGNEIKDTAAVNGKVAAATDSAVPSGSAPTSPEASQTDGETPEASGQPDSGDKTGLTPGSHSPEVVKMQERLMELDYMEPDEPTDFYGSQTNYSLQLFQRKNGLQIDGIAGTKTLEILYSKKAKPYTVNLGADGTDVEELQKRLVELKFLKEKATGHFGEDTEKAVKEFQKQNDLDIDGNVGSNTREVLYSEDAKKYTPPEKKTDNKKNTKPKSKPKPKPKPKPAKNTTKVPDGERVNKLIAFAKQQLGKEYVRGGKGPNVFDCSGFVYYCLKNTGLKLHYMTSGGWAGSSWPRVTKMSYLKAGDIICFHGHVGIYLGGGRMIDASSGQDKIRITGNIFSSSYWKRNFICGRRVLYK
jgi:peptidoglycan hydrolase-like protein with peptidoglycan-binding domain